MVERSIIWTEKRRVFRNREEVPIGKIIQRDGGKRFVSSTRSTKGEYLPSYQVS